jgi:8-oxo-dGTP diphosphatase
MLNRIKAPNKGLWNGVGGKIEPVETPERGVIREIEEETGIEVQNPKYTGVVKWQLDGIDKGGMHVFIVDLDQDSDYPTPVQTDEGILDWKKLSWVLEEDNYGVVSNIRHFLPDMIRSKEPLEFQCYYRNGYLAEVKELGLTR